MTMPVFKENVVLVGLRLLIIYCVGLYTNSLSNKMRDNYILLGE